MENSLYTIINAIGWSIIHSIWQGAIIYIVLSCSILLFPKQSAKSRHHLTFMAMIFIFVGFCANIVYYYTKSKDLSAVLPIDKQSILYYLNHVTANQSILEQLMPYIVYIYTIGLIIQVIILSNNFVKLKTLKYKGLHQAPNAWVQKFLIAKYKLGIQKNVKFYLSDLVSIPLTLGHLKPIVLFPVAYANQMSLEQVESILIHELAHIKRNDYFINLIKVIIESLLFFNPFIWKISKLMEVEREHACDDMVIDVAPAMTYAHALVECETLRNKVNSPLTLAASNSKHQLFNRIKRITKMEKNYSNMKQQLIAITVSVATLITVLWIIPIKAEAQEAVHKIIEVIQTAPAVVNIKLIEPVKTVVAPPHPAAECAVVVPEPASMKEISSTVNVPDTSKLPKHVKKFIAEIQKNTADIQKYYESPEWKSKIKDLEQQSKELTKQFESPEWKEKIINMEQYGKDMEELVNSPAFQNKIADIEKSAQEIEKYFQSDEWKNQMKNFEKQGQEIQKKFESEEWKSKIKAIELNGQKLEKYFKSEEWQNKMKKLNKFDGSSKAEEIKVNTEIPLDINL